MSEALNRVRESYRKLAAVASNINSASDRLGSSIAPLEAGIRNLGLDVSSWVVFNEWHSEDQVEYRIEEIGYAKSAGTWGLAIRTRAGDEDSPAWPFNEAPRAMRARSIEKIPDLLEQLVKDATRVEADIVSQVETVEALGEAVLSNSQDIQAIATAVFTAPEPPAPRNTAQSDSAAAAAKVRRFLQLKDLSE